MASSPCIRCLLRPARLPIQSPASLVLLPRAFSTTAPANGSATSTKKGGASGKAPPKKTPTTFQLKKKKVERKTGKPPAPGERKAMRKRVVLSNTNALAVADLEDLNEQMVEDMISHAPTYTGQAGIVDVRSNASKSKEYHGKVVGYDGKTVDSLRAVDAFKPTQSWELFRRPAVVLRQESVVLNKYIVDAQKDKKTVRMVIDGERNTGKSLMLVNAMATAFVKNWVVINIPEAQELTNAVTEYAPLAGSKPLLWIQPNYIANLLSQIAKANASVLDHLEVTLEHDLPVNLPPKTSLTRLCELGGRDGRDVDYAWPIFQAFWSEITTPGKPPIMMCMDSISFIMQNSLYHTQDFTTIHSHDLALVRHFVDLLSGTKPLPNGGAILGATSRSHAPLSKSLDLALQQAEDRAEASARKLHPSNKESTEYPITKRDPYERNYDARVDEVLKDIQTMKIGGISKDEARGLMEYWAKSGVLRATVDEKSVAEKWALAGNGVIGEIQRGSLWMRI